MTHHTTHLSLMRTEQNYSDPPRAAVAAPSPSSRIAGTNPVSLMLALRYLAGRVQRRARVVPLPVTS